MSKPGSEGKKKDEPPAECKIDDIVFNIFGNLKSTLESESAATEAAKSRESRLVPKSRTSELRLKEKDATTCDDEAANEAKKKNKAAPSNKVRTRKSSPAVPTKKKGKTKSGTSKEGSTNVTSEDVSVEQKPAAASKKQTTIAVKPHQLEAGTVILSNSEKKFTVKGVMPRHGSRLFGHFYTVEGADQKLGAMKTEMKIPQMADRMFVEAMILVRATRYRGIFHFPTMLDLGETRDFRFLITDPIGWSLEEIIMFHKIEPKTALTLSIETFEAIEELHLMGFVHRDIKPANFAVGVNDNKHRVFLVEMQFAVVAPDPRVKTTPKYKFIGSQRYASRAAHQGKTALTSRCDIESWLYMCIDFFDSDGLPWAGIDNKEATYDLKEKMFRHPQGVLSILPKKFEEIVAEIGETRQLAPNYVLIHETLKTMAGELEIDLDAPFEFEIDETFATTAPTALSMLDAGTKSGDELVPVTKTALKSPAKGAKKKKKKPNKKKKKKEDDDDEGATVDEEEEEKPTPMKSPAKRNHRTKKRKGKPRKGNESEDPGVDIDED